MQAEFAVRPRRLVEHSLAVRARRPRLDYEPRAVAPDRIELGALLVTAALGSPPRHVLISLSQSCRSAGAGITTSGGGNATAGR